MTVEEKANLILQLTKEIVQEVKENDDIIGEMMRAFGDEYIHRMQSFANIFKNNR